MLSERFLEARNRLRNVLFSGADVLEALAAHSEEVDGILSQLFSDALPGSDPRGFALLALGGYGRRELAPHSDLDLLLIHRGRGPDEVEEFNRAFMYPLWDSGMEVGNRVRTLGETYQMLTRTDEATAVVEARHVCGDEELGAAAVSGFRAELIRRRSRFISSLGQANRERHATSGHAGHRLEPNVRDGAGGLRDIQALMWVGSLENPHDPLESLRDDGYLTAEDLDGLRSAHKFFNRVRTHAHLIAGRREDTLLLDTQDALAESLGYTGPVPGDFLMRDVFGYARHVAAVHNGVWDLLTHRPHRKGWLRRTIGESVVADGVMIRRGRIEVVSAPDPDDNPAFWVGVFDQAAKLGSEVGRTTISRLRRELDSVQLGWTAELAVGFATLLLRGRSAVPQLHAMEQAGLLEALIPEWSRVRALPQRNLYHRLSVDAHLFETVVELVESRTNDELAEVWRDFSDPTPLVWAALLHDIGKGSQGDHSMVGANLAARIAGRVGLSDADVDTVVWLVRNHLVLAETAIRRDISDPGVIQGIVDTAGSTARLSMLYLLTRADSLATGPEAWTLFRTRLIAELYERSHARLSGGEIDPSDSVVAEILSQIPPGATTHVSHHLDDGVDVITVVAPDRTGLFADIAGVLSDTGVDVLGARLVELPDGSAAEQFRVRGSAVTLNAGAIERVNGALLKAINGEFEPKQSTRNRRVPRLDPFLRVDVSKSRELWIVEVHATDRPGLLRAIASAISSVGADIRKAMIATYGVEVVDVFYVRSDEELQPTRIRAAIMSALR